MSLQNVKFFSFSDSKDFANKVVGHLNLELSSIKERDFEDGEHKSRSLVNVRGKDVFVIQQIFKDENLSLNDRLIKLLFLCGAMKDAAANTVSAVIPYLCYSRKDRKTKSRDPVTTRYVAQLFEAVNVDRIITMDVHNLQAYQNAFRNHIEHLEARIPLMDQFIKSVDSDNLMVMSPDIGGVKRANHYKKYLESKINIPVKLGLMEKERSFGEVTGELVAGDFAGRQILIIDDLVSSGSTLVRAAKAAKKEGAKKVTAAVTHGIFTGNANEILEDSSLDKVITTNSLPLFRLSKSLLDRKIQIVDVTAYIAEAIKRIVEGGSLVELNQWK